MAGRHGRAQRILDRRVIGEVDQHDATAVLALQVPDPAPRDGPLQVVRVRRTAGQRDQPRRREPVVGHHVGEHPGHHPGQLVGGGRLDAHDVRHGSPACHRGPQRVRVSEDVHGGLERGRADQRPVTRLTGRLTAHRFPVRFEQLGMQFRGGRDQAGRRVGQPVPRDRPHGRARDGADRVDLGGHRGRGQQFPAHGQHIHGLGRHHVGDHGRAELVVRPSGDRGVQHSAHRAQCLFHPLRAHLLVADPDQVGEPAGHREVAGLVTPGEVTGAVPAGAQRRGGRIRTVVVAARHHVRPADPQLALLPDPDVGSGERVDDAHAQARQWQAPRIAVTAWPAHRDGAAGLGGRVDVQQRSVERRGERRPQGFAGGRADCQPCAQLGRVGVEQRAQQRGGPGDDRAALLTQRRAQLVTGQAIGQPDGRADRDGGQHRQVVAEPVVQRQRPQQAVLFGQSEHRGVGGGGRPQRVALRGQHSLAGPGRSRRVDQEGQLVQAEVVAGRGVGLGGRQVLEGRGGRGLARARTRRWWPVAAVTRRTTRRGPGR